MFIIKKKSLENQKLKHEEITYIFRTLMASLLVIDFSSN